MLSINTIARVVVNTVRAAATSASFDTGLLLVKDSSFAESRRLQTYDSSAEAAAGLTALGFANASEVYKAALKYFAASPAPGRLLVSCYPSAENLTEALAAVLNKTASFYGVMVCNSVAPSAADYAAFAQVIEALSQPLVLFVPVNSAGSNSTLGKLHEGRFRRAFPFYCTVPSDCAAVMGTAMGLELSHRDSAFQGIEPADLTQTTVDTLKAMNGNVYVARGYTHFLLENGSMANGQRYDEVFYVDRIAADLQEAAVAMLAENPDKMPQTDDSTAQFINRFSSILMNYTGMGVLATAAWRGADIGPVREGDIIENGFLMWADSYDDQPDADRMAHKAVPIQCALTLAGSIESIVITVNVQV